MKVKLSALVGLQELTDTAKEKASGYQLVVGPTGSPLQLVLNSVFHLDRSAGLIPYSLQRELGGEAKRRDVRLAVPYAVGDSFRGFRVILDRPRAKPGGTRQGFEHPA